MKPDHLEIANRVAEEKLQQQIDLMRKLYTAQGFYQYWFDNLGKYKSNAECFRAVNDLHQELFGVPRYSEYNNFIRWASKHIKNNENRT